MLFAAEILRGCPLGSLCTSRNLLRRGKDRAGFAKLHEKISG